jgi:hypothetical protein
MDPRIFDQFNINVQNTTQSLFGAKTKKKQIDYLKADVWSLGIILY